MMVWDKKDLMKIILSCYLRGVRWIYLSQYFSCPVLDTYSFDSFSFNSAADPSWFIILSFSNFFVFFESYMVANVCVALNSFYIPSNIIQLPLVLICPVVQICHDHRSKDHLMKDFCDGEFYCKHQLFSADEQALQVLLYNDDIEICNPLGSRAKVHKMCE